MRVVFNGNGYIDVKQIEIVLPGDFHSAWNPFSEIPNSINSCKLYFDNIDDFQAFCDFIDYTKGKERLLRNE